MGDASGTKGIDPADVRTALDDILQSETFARSERSRELIKYIVERDLEGQSDRLKGFAIALDVFDREDNFDPSTDAVVRVQAGRLRDLLETYYSGEGANAAIRITIPRGTYVPLYDLMLRVPPLCGDPGTRGKGLSRAPVPAGAKQASAAPKGKAPAGTHGDYDRMFFVNMRLFWLAASVVIVMLAGILALMVDSYFTDRARVASDAQSAPLPQVQQLSASEALPSIAVMSDTDMALRRALEDAIPRFGSVVYRNDRSVTLEHPLADFYIQTVQVGHASLNVQFFHRESGIMIGADHIPRGGTDAELADHISRILSRFLPVGGAIYAFLESDGRLNPVTKCLVLSSAYFSDQNPERHRVAYDCHQDLLKNGVRSALSFANLASLSVESVTDGYDYPAGTTLDDAIRLGRRGIELAPLSASVHRSLAYALQASGEYSAALQEIRGAYAFNPYDLGIAASYGNTLVAVGDFSLAVSVLERAAKASPVHPSWWDYALFVAAFQTDRQDLVSLSTRNLVGRERAHYCAARLIAAHMEGNDELREKMLGELARHDSTFLRDPLAFYSRIMPKDAAKKLTVALGEAGLKLPVSNDG